jgi:hypothetical protein
VVIVDIDAIRYVIRRTATTFDQHVQKDAIRNPEYEVIYGVYLLVRRVAGDIDDAELLALVGDFQHVILINRRHGDLAKDACLRIIIVLIDDLPIVVFFVRLLKELEVLARRHDLQDARESLQSQVDFVYIHAEIFWDDVILDVIRSGHGVDVSLNSNHDFKCASIFLRNQNLIYT